MIFCFDLDGTICRTINGDYENARPIQYMVDHVNNLYAEGHRIIFQTARGSVTGKDWGLLTQRQLKSWGIHYHELHFDKPYADVYIDDKAEKPPILKMAAIVQARMGSTRLPGKIMMDIGGKPLLTHVIENAQKAVNHVILATTADSTEAMLWACSRGIPVYVGSENDVLDRYYQTAKLHRLETIIRITADNPLIDPEMVKKLIRFYEEGNYDWAANCRLKVTYPVGNDAEIFSFGALQKAWQNATDSYDRECVTSYIYHHPELFNLGVIENDRDESHLRWTVDTMEDLERVREIYRHKARRELCQT